MSRHIFMDATVMKGFYSRVEGGAGLKVGLASGRGKGTSVLRE